MFEEGLFEVANLLVEEVVGLVDEADDDVGGDLWGPGFDEGAEDVVGGMGRMGRMGRMRHRG